MMSRQRLEEELRRIRRPRIPPDTRDRVLRGAAELGPEQAARSAGVMRPRRWRLVAASAAAAVALAVVIGGGLRLIAPGRPGTPPPPPAEALKNQPVKSPGDDVVVFWLDDETPVYVELSKP